MSKLNRLLFQLFERLRQQGVPLGVSDYLEAIETIQAGIGLENLDSLKNILSLFWVKSLEDRELFNIAFADKIENNYKSKSQTRNQPQRASNTPDFINRNPQPFIEQDKLQSKVENTKASPSQTKKVKLPLRLQQQLLLDDIINDKIKDDKQDYYQLTPRLTMSCRDMAGIWRKLRRSQIVGVPEELDVEATINNISNTGFLLTPILKPRRRNQAKLVLLIDKQGSMTPFEPLIETIIESILRGGLLGKTSIYYFHDYPENYLYKFPTLTNALPLAKVLDEQAKGNSVLIISDAGAAHGYYDKVRVAETKVFFQTLNTYTYLYAWLNPMPKNRWNKTTAEEIARIVPMFSLNREGLNDAVNILRGHPFPSGVGIHE